MSFPDDPGGTHVFPRMIRDQLPRAVKGDGVYIIDADGKRYLDGSGGAAVSCLGHSDTDVIRAIQDQAETLAFAHTGFFTSQPAENLADHLIGKAPDGIDRVYFVSGGSEAIEAALKMARQYFLEIGEPARTLYRPSPELPRQYPGGAVHRRQCAQAQAVRAVPNRG